MNLPVWVFTFAVLLLTGVPAEADQSAEEKLPQLPLAISNNAVALLATDDGLHLYSMLGLERGKSWSNTSSVAMHFHSSSGDADGSWESIAPVPGGVGRLAASAVTVAGDVFVFGGYTVAADGSEQSTPAVYRLQRGSGQWQHFTDMPVPVEDSVLLAYMDRYVYLVSGWHDLGNINLVQVLDTATGEWQQATPYPGAPVFGHAGGLSQNHLLICDGVRIDYSKSKSRRQFLSSRDCWRGEISPDNFRQISWQPIDPHPGQARYRMAASDDGAGRVYFAGGAVNPYNFDGTGYDGNPSEPEAEVFSFDFKESRWACHGSLSVATMDHRGMPWHEGWFYIIGGMRRNQQVSAGVVRFKPAMARSSCTTLAE